MIHDLLYMEIPDNVSSTCFGDIFEHLLTQAKTPNLVMIQKPVFFIPFWLPCMNGNQIPISKSIIIIIIILLTLVIIIFILMAKRG